MLIEATPCALNYEDREWGSSEVSMNDELNGVVWEKTRPAARAVSISPSWLYKHADEIPAAHRAGRAVRWDVGALKAWMRDQAAAKANGRK